jgi:hypothetical protein
MSHPIEMELTRGPVRLVSRRGTLATSLTKSAFGAPSAEAPATIEAEDWRAALRRAVYEYEQKRRDLESKFETALATLREPYLASSRSDT